MKKVKVKWFGWGNIRRKTPPNTISETEVKIVSTDFPILKTTVIQNQ